MDSQIERGKIIFFVIVGVALVSGLLSLFGLIAGIGGRGSTLIHMIFIGAIAFGTYRGSPGGKLFLGILMGIGAINVIYPIFFGAMSPLKIGFTLFVAAAMVAATVVLFKSKDLAAFVEYQDNWYTPI